MKMPITIVAINLVNGDKLLATHIDYDEEWGVEIIDPIVVFASPKGTEIQPYSPFSDGIVTIHNMHIVTLGMANKDGCRLYGASLQQIAIERIKSSAQSKLTGNKMEDYFTIAKSLADMKEIADQFKETFGIDPPDFSDMDSYMEENRPICH